MVNRDFVFGEANALGGKRRRLVGVYDAESVALLGTVDLQDDADNYRCNITSSSDVDWTGKRATCRVSERECYQHQDLDDRNDERAGHEALPGKLLRAVGCREILHPPLLSRACALLSCANYRSVAAGLGRERLGALCLNFVRTGRAMLWKWKDTNRESGKEIVVEAERSERRCDQRAAPNERTPTSQVDGSGTGTTSSACRL